METQNNNNNNCFSSLILLLLILPEAASAANDVSPFCTDEAMKQDQKALCTKFIKGAKTWPNAMTNAIKAVIQISIEAIPMVKGLEKKLPHRREGVADVCKDALDDQISRFRQCIDLVNNDPTHALVGYLGGIIFGRCKNAFEDDHIDNPDVDRFLDTTINFTEILISVFQMKPLRT